MRLESGKLQSDQKKGQTMTTIRGGAPTIVSPPGVFLPFGYGDHPVITPNIRWLWCAGYWAFCALAAHATGKIDYVLNQEWMKPNALYAVHLVMLNAIGLAAWDWSAFSFERPFRLFAAIVYPLFHTLDSLMWYVVYDISKFVLNKVLDVVGIGEVSKILQYLFGVAVLGGGYITAHRGFLEYRCLPEHHPLSAKQGGRGSKVVYVVGLALCSLPMFAIYEWFGDMRFGVLTRYTADVYFAIRMRLGNPWDPYGNEDNLEHWKPLMKGY